MKYLKKLYKKKIIYFIKLVNAVAKSDIFNEFNSNQRTVKCFFS